MKTRFIFSTYPEIIKFAPLIELFAQKEEGFYIINTMLQYDDLLSKIFGDGNVAKKVYEKMIKHHK
tara:strand:- start:257 stop:454 length:198 start_codon:yes stop_codon:yes gene_type:complete